MRSTAALLLAAVAAASGCAARANATAAPRQLAQEIVARPADAPAAAVEAGADESAETADGVVHVVQPGQTLWRIARVYDVSLDELARVNGIDDPSHVDVGTPIFVPGARATLDVAAYPAPLAVKPSAPPVRPEASADFLWPVAAGTFMRPFGEPRRHHTHAGVDIRGSRGQDILAARDGIVAFGGPTRTGYGSMVVLDHGDGVQTLYAHAQKVLVHPGETVHRGQTIALLGRTGNATTEHCHFEIRLSNRAVDPMPFLLGTTEAHR